MVFFKLVKRKHIGSTYLQQLSVLGEHKSFDLKVLILLLAKALKVLLLN